MATAAIASLQAALSAAKDVRRKSMPTLLAVLIWFIHPCPREMVAIVARTEMVGLALDGILIGVHAITSQDIGRAIEKTLLVPLRAAAGLPALAADVAELGPAAAAVTVSASCREGFKVLKVDSRHVVAAEGQLDHLGTRRAAAPSCLVRSVQQFLRSLIGRALAWVRGVRTQQTPQRVAGWAGSTITSAMGAANVSRAGRNTTVKLIRVLELLTLGFKRCLDVLGDEISDVVVDDGLAAAASRVERDVDHDIPEQNREAFSTELMLAWSRIGACDGRIVQARVALDQGCFVLLLAGVLGDVDRVAIICKAAVVAVTLELYLERLQSEL